MKAVLQHIIKTNLPRLFNLYNLDPLSKTFGNASRTFHGWKTQDFANGTFLGGLHTIAIAYQLKLLPEDFPIQDFCDVIFDSIPQYTNGKGALAEAYPNEGSFCVTALGAFDLLSAIRILDKVIENAAKRRYLEALDPLIQYITKQDEKHAIISNHLATGVAAIALWNRLTGNQNPRWKQLLDVILSNQSDEGWYKEYEGADPGYQTLCTYYLAIANELLEEPSLQSSLEQSLEFIQYFIHPDGSIGGLYGSRNTQVFYPAGFAILKNSVSFSIMNRFAYGLSNNVHVTPSSIDIDNYIPLLNAYANAVWYSSEIESVNQPAPLPHQQIFSKRFDHAGIYIKSTAEYYAILNFKKGGAIKVFRKKDNLLEIEDGGLAGILKNGKRFSTQMYDQNQQFRDFTINPSFYLINESYPNPFTTIIVRLLSLTFFRFTWFNNFFKKRIVRHLMTRKAKLKGGCTRHFAFNENAIIIEEQVIPPSESIEIKHYGSFRAIHMASSSYNPMPQLYRQQDSSIVKFERK